MQFIPHGANMAGSIFSSGIFIVYSPTASILYLFHATILKSQKQGTAKRHSQHDYAVWLRPSTKAPGSMYDVFLEPSFRVKASRCRHPECVFFLCLQSEPYFLIQAASWAVCKESPYSNFSPQAEQKALSGDTILPQKGHTLSAFSASFGCASTVSVLGSMSIGSV